MCRRYKDLRLLASLFLVFTLAAPALAVVTPDEVPARDKKHRPDELLVKFKPGVGSGEAESLARGQGAREVHEFRRPRRLQSAPMPAPLPGGHAFRRRRREWKTSAVDHRQIQC